MRRGERGACTVLLIPFFFLPGWSFVFVRAVSRRGDKMVNMHSAVFFLWVFQFRIASIRVVVVGVFTWWACDEIH